MEEQKVCRVFGRRIYRAFAGTTNHCRVTPGKILLGSLLALGPRHADMDLHGAALTHRVHHQEERGQGRPHSSEPRRGAGCRGFEGGSNAPLASPNVLHWVGWLLLLLLLLLLCL